LNSEPSSTLLFVNAGFITRRLVKRKLRDFNDWFLIHGTLFVANSCMMRGIT
jgi:hypothetical protein